MSGYANSLEKQWGYWGEHPNFSIADWMEDVANIRTRLGYWQWVAQEIRIQMENER